MCPGRETALARKVLLVNPNQMKPPVAPLALDYLASALSENGFEVDLLDLCFCQNPEDFTAEIDRYFALNSVFTIAITLRNTDDTCFTTQDFFIPRIKEIIDSIRAHSSAPLIMGGSGFSTMPEAILQYCNLDMGIWGEGEYSLPLLLTKMAGGEDYHGVPGLVYRVTKGYRRNPPEYLDLKNIAAPERNAVDNRRYFLEGGMGNIEAKRGCPKRCIYCADPLAKGRAVRQRSPKSVVDEIEVLLQMGMGGRYVSVPRRAWWTRSRCCFRWGLTISTSAIASSIFRLLMPRRYASKSLTGGWDPKSGGMPTVALLHLTRSLLPCSLRRGALVLTLASIAQMTICCAL